MNQDPVAGRIKERRQAQGLSQEAFAAKAGVPRWMVANIESGRRNVSSHEVAVFADALALDADVLLGRAPSVRAYRNPELTPAVAEAMGRFESYAAASLRMEDLEQFRGRD